MTIDSNDDIWHPVPESMDSPGGEGWMAKDDNFIYIYTGGRWLRKPIAIWIP
jgi:hypothetical protein